MAYLKYDYQLLAVERHIGTWVPVAAARVGIQADYSVQDNRAGIPPSAISTLILGSETATVTLDRLDSQGEILFVGDEVRIAYDGHQLFLGVCAGVTRQYRPDPSVARLGASLRVTLTYNLVGEYAALMGRTVTWTNLPVEDWITRIRRFVLVLGW